MASIGAINIGGNNLNRSSSLFESGVCFYLDKMCKTDKIYYFDNNSWEVELKLNQNNIVARYKNAINADEILIQGFTFCEYALDIMSVEGDGEYRIESPGSNHIVLYRNSLSYVLRETSLLDLHFKFSAKATVLDSNGQIVIQKEKPQILWKPEYRYYRLSQSENDVYEAYRNLFLAFESLLNSLCQKQSGERETIWFKRALSFISTKINLSDYVLAGSKDQVNDFYQTYYVNIRCKLFHSKDGISILPHELIHPIDIENAYDVLLRLWGNTLDILFGVKRKSGGLTRYGLLESMNIFMNGFDLYLSDQNIAQDIHEETLNALQALDSNLIRYDSTEYKGETSFGHVLLVGNLEKENLSQTKSIVNIFTTTNDNLISVATFENPIIPEGIDRMESHHYIRLVNTDMPKKVFTIH